MKKWLKKIGYFLLGLAVLYLLLLIPDPGNTPEIVRADKKPFAWNRDSVWLQMEQRFRQVKQLDGELLDSAVLSHKKILATRLAGVQMEKPPYYDAVWSVLENDFFNAAALVAAHPAQQQWLIDYYTAFRILVKQLSQQWDMGNTEARNTVYKLLYGMRAATEEVLLQADSMKYSPAMLIKDEPSVTPTASIFGITVHSGDLLVSRGGAEVSALISRGNDYPGNFSHVALVYVDEKDRRPYLIEAHIEKGVAVASVEQYENDKKLRFMVMRPRKDLTAMMADSMLPQKAAGRMFVEAAKRHIPYDFKMNFHDSSALFCSEVASYGYRQYGISLWKYPSTISSQGVVSWLKDFGVENFVTQMPSDLEYDPQLTVVAEWRDPETLYKDHVDNAVMDALLEKAESGEKIGYDLWQLPFVRVLKGYCMLKNLFGRTGIIPEGMSATRALKNQTFVVMHVHAKEKTLQKAAGFRKQNGYRPPYWQLVKFAREAVKETY